MQQVDVVGQGWAVSAGRPVRFRERLTGMRHGGSAMLFGASSVHGIGMDHALTLVVLDRACRVRAVTTLRPRTVRWFPGARWILELDPSIAPPQVGSQLALYARSDGGTTRGVRHTDRQSG